MLYLCLCVCLDISYICVCVVGDAEVADCLVSLKAGSDTGTHTKSLHTEEDPPQSPSKAAAQPDNTTPQSPRIKEKPLETREEKEQSVDNDGVCVCVCVCVRVCVCAVSSVSGCSLCTGSEYCVKCWSTASCVDSTESTLSCHSTHSAIPTCVYKCCVYVSCDT